MFDTTRTRRWVLGAGTGLAAALAGCSGSGADPEPTANGDLDLREANVVGVEVERDGKRVRFDVTLHHDDSGEDGYANWWQVETLGGERLGRRDLTHPHATQPFTRSSTFTVGTTLPCVVVRGHDETHGYGGQAMTVDIETGATLARPQGTEKQSFSSADCP